MPRVPASVPRQRPETYAKSESPALTCSGVPRLEKTSGRPAASPDYHARVPEYGATPRDAPAVTQLSAQSPSRGAAQPPGGKASSTRIVSIEGGGYTAATATVTASRKAVLS